MKIVTIFLSLSFVGVVFCICCGASGSQSENNGRAENVEMTTTKAVGSEALKCFQKVNTKSYGQWDVGETSPFSYFVKREGENDELWIVDSLGKELYRKTGIQVERIYPITALRTMAPQIVFEYGEGGNDSYVQMLDYVKGRVIEKIESSNGENEFSGGILIQPQFRSGINPANEPFEIVLDDYGLPSAARHSARVLRYDGNEYRKFGMLDQQQAADCKEKLITSK